MGIKGNVIGCNKEDITGFNQAQIIITCNEEISRRRYNSQ